jgi:hypothetical protein
MRRTRSPARSPARSNARTDTVMPSCWYMVGGRG